MGRPLGSKNKNYVSVKDRLLKNVFKDSVSGCWIKTKVSKNKYATMRINGKKLKAHRVAYEIFNNVIIDDEMVICHHCDNPPCINPKHLFMGTIADNNTDKMKKGRHKFDPPHGMRCSNSILTDEKVMDILDKINQGLSNLEIANIFKVTRQTISRIRNNKIWKHISREKAA
jgi:DNA-binding CsgD family transcriptional regulator